MMKIVADLHTHTIVSGHAYGTIREMAASAAERKLSMLGITEHAPGVPGTADPLYYGNISAVPRELYGVKMLFGSEINVLNDGTLSLSQEYIDMLDYAIAGIHTICYENEEVEGNTDNLISCMKNDKVCFVSHPDDDHTPLDYERLVIAAKEYHVALEVNNSSFKKPDKRLNCVENYRKMLSLCMKHRVPVIISSDAHDPSCVGDFSLAIDLIERCNFDTSLVLNTDVDKIEEFIGFSHREDS
ncbi:MAG: phosphatase [Synergistaceae bacterium]|nr:phosphatase [Synergistaceae bacterium]MBQ3399061.1 phosphatase [Synergistaceae bacterium]MBQ6418194.1 phosphatase [Synergistaceae bacterium]MBQ6665921.1 phosphatase [Synergistaceae bacterium]